MKTQLQKLEQLATLPNKGSIVLLKNGTIGEVDEYVIGAFRDEFLLRVRDLETRNTSLAQRSDIEYIAQGNVTATLEDTFEPSRWEIEYTPRGRHMEKYQVALISEDADHYYVWRFADDAHQGGYRSLLKKSTGKIRQIA